jgi:hypothetical protein
VATKNHVCEMGAGICLWLHALRQKPLQLSGDQMFARVSRQSYSPIPKLSIWVAACSANFKTFPEYVWQFGVFVPRTHPL